MKDIRKVAIMMRLGLDGEALNNEGNVGNVLIPRTVLLKDGTIRNALSGEMMKHFHSRNLGLLADSDELCSTCKIFSPMKNGTVEEKDKKLSDNGNRVKNCLVDDIEGFMNAGKGRNEKRTSCIRFSWGIAAEENEYETHLHTRVDPTEKNATKKEKHEDTTSDANEIEEQNTQMIFHRPLRSDEYAITIQLELDRIGFDDEKLVYTLPQNVIKTRQKKAIKALINMFVDMEGALCSTRLPHLRNIKGIVVDKQNKDEVLVKYSALNEDFQEVNERLATNSIKFDNVEEFVKVLSEIV